MIGSLQIKDQRILVLGAKGLVGSHVVSKLKEKGCKDVLKCGREHVDLSNQKSCNLYFYKLSIIKQINVVFLCAAKVGGIVANNENPVDFITTNLKIQTNVLENCFKYGIKKVIFLGSSCIYPKLAKQPMKESYLMTGELEPTNSAYAVAKIAGIEMCKSYNKQYNTNFIAAMPTNLYGPRDNFDLNTSHVIPALIRKFHEAKENNTDVVLWGDGSSMREFLYVDDLADALIFLAENYNATKNDCLINVGFGEDISIRKLAEMIKWDVVGFEGHILWDTSKPNGTPKKLLDTSKINKLGWTPKIGLLEGLQETYEWYIKNR